jgi:hypothetical protein
LISQDGCVWVRDKGALVWVVRRELNLSSMEWDWAMIKTLAEHVRFLPYEVLTSKQHWRAPLLSHRPSSPSLVSNFLKASSGGKRHIFSWPFDQTYSQATGFQHQQPKHGLLQDASLFYFNGRFFLFTFTFLATSFFFPFPRREGNFKYGKWTAFLSHILYYDTILPSARLFRWLIFWFLLWIII